ncbi:dihydroorotase family protein [Thermoproteota archaeon]
MSLLIKNCKLISGETEVTRNIYISNGIIQRITVRSPKADRVYDARNNFVIPGVIDSHVHFREPGLAYKEDFYTGSRAAAAGGITTVLDMPNTVPPTFTINDLEEKRILARKSIINYGFYMGTSAQDNVRQVYEAQKRNIAGTKIFMNLSTGNLLVEDMNLLEKYFRASKLVAVHAQGQKAAEAVHYSKKFMKNLYLCHITLREEIDFLRREKIPGIYVEATPHHLFLTDQDFRKMKGFAKMIPPLVSKDDQNALWDAIEEGIIDTIGTDHAPHTLEEKIVEEPPAGVPGVETMLPLLLDAVNKGRLSLKKVVELTSVNPAKIFGMKGKGGLAPGYHADLTIVDMNLTREVRNDNLKTRCGWSPFNGWKLKGWPVTTIVGGKIVFDHGKLYKNQGREVLFKG